jgi:hypothetical protein
MKNVICLSVLVLCVTGCNTITPVAPVDTLIKLATPIKIDSDSTPSAEPIIDAGSPIEASDTSVEPKEPVKRNLIVQYTIKGCRWCDYDRERIIPKWVEKGWKFPSPIDESDSPKGAYPRYEIYDAEGKLRRHTGSLLSWRN